MRASCEAVRRARPFLGTLVEIRASGRDAGRAVQRAFAAIERVHRAMSRQDRLSDIARIRAGRFQALDGWTRAVLERAAELRELSDGLFDPAACGYSLDGIAKGFAVDRAIEVLQGHGAKNGAVNAGGDLRFFGETSERIYLRPPGRPSVLLDAGEMRNAAVATSAALLLVDPLGRRVRRRNRGVSVIAQDCATADALTKPCLLEPQRAAQLAARLGARAVPL